MMRIANASVIGLSLLGMMLAGCGGNQAAAGPSAADTPLAPIAARSGERVFRIIPQKSVASYHAQEKWANWSVPTKAVATTGDVEGELALNAGDQIELRANHFRVDLRTLVSRPEDTPLSNRLPVGLFLSGRDGVTRTRLETDRYPFAEFSATAVDGIPRPYVEGQPASVRVSGDLTIHNITRPATFEVQVTLKGDELTGTANVDVNMTDFGVEPPSIRGTNVEDRVTLRLEFVASAVASAVSPDQRSPKLDFALATVAQAARVSGAAAGLARAQGVGLETDGDSVRVVLDCRPACESAQEAIEEAGGQIEVTQRGPATGRPLAFQALIPVTAIGQVAAGEAISAMRAPIRE